MDTLKNYLSDFKDTFNYGNLHSSGVTLAIFYPTKQIFYLEEKNATSLSLQATFSGQNRMIA